MVKIKTGQNLNSMFNFVKTRHQLLEITFWVAKKFNVVCCIITWRRKV